MTPEIVGTVLVLVVGFFVWLHFSTQRTINHQLQTLARLSCPSCSSAYGIDTAQRARVEYLEFCERQRKERPDLRINFARLWTVRCPRCSTEAQFNFETCSLSVGAA